jgi:hypothetical protein
LSGSQFEAVHKPAHVESQFYDYLVGIADIEGAIVLILVSESEPVLDFDTLMVFKIKDIHLHVLSQPTDQKDEVLQLKMKEDTKRITRLLTKYGYYARGANLSSSFIHAIKGFYEVPDTIHMDKSLAKGLVNLAYSSSLDRFRRKEYSANYGLIKVIEKVMKKQLWMFDVVLVGRYNRGICRQSHDT